MTYMTFLFICTSYMLANPTVSKYTLSFYFSPDVHSLLYLPHTIDVSYVVNALPLSHHHFLIFVIVLYVNAYVYILLGVNTWGSTQRGQTTPSLYLFFIEFSLCLLS